MRVSVAVVCSTAEAAKSFNQVVERFNKACAALCVRYPPFTTIDHLVVQLTLNHPLSPSGRPGGSYWAKERTFLASAPVDYSAWIAQDWKRRVEATGAAVLAAIQRIHKTRVTVNERQALVDLVGDIAARLEADPPPTLFPLGPVWLRDSEDENQGPTISYAAPGEFGRTLPGMSAVQPEQALEVAAALNAASEPELDFKLYRRVEGQLEYYEAWPAPLSVIEHRGVCGDRGRSWEHSAPTPQDQAAILNKLKANGRREGFRSIAPSRHSQVIVGSAIDGFGTSADLELRHRLEDFLNRTAGWLGLGHCDGGSTGSGSMEALCIVVDPALAVQVINRELAGSDFSRFTARKA